MTNRERIALAAILGVALALRLVHVHDLSADVLFDHPMLDEDRYVTEARALATGGAFEPRAFWQPPGVMIALAAVFRVFGLGLAWPRYVQALLGVATVALAFALARRLFSTRVGLATAAVVALHGALVFAGGELLPATWACALDLAALLLLLDAPRSTAHAAGAGALLGASTIMTPIVLPFAALAAIWIFRTTDAAKRAERVGAFTGGLLLPIAPVTYRNWREAHELVLVSTNGGLNFFLGNNERYADTFALRPGVHWTELVDEPRRVAHIDAARASSSYFFAKGFAFWREHPLSAIGLYLRKLFLFFHAAEIPRDADVYAARATSRVLRVLVTPRPTWLPDGALVPLALLGVAASWRARARLFLPLAFVATQALAISAFIVTSRYRVPSLPIFAMFAVAGVAFVAENAMRASRARVVGAIAAMLALVLVLHVPTRETALSFASETDLYRGLAYLRHRRDRENAIVHFRRATDADPRDPRPWFELGNALDASGRADEAASAWEEAANRDASDLRPRRMIAAAAMKRGDRASAARALEANVAANGREQRAYFLEHMQLAAMHAEDHDAHRMLDELRSASLSDPNAFRGAASAFERKYMDELTDSDTWHAVRELARAASGP